VCVAEQLGNVARHVKRRRLLRYIAEDTRIVHKEDGVDGVELEAEVIVCGEMINDRLNGVLNTIMEEPLQVSARPC